MGDDVRYSDRENPMKKTRLYFAYPVRGKMGHAASRQQMDDNCEMAMEICTILQDLLGDEVVIYCPHANEHLFKTAYDAGQITSDDILDHCLEIVGLCDGIVMGCDPAASQGMMLELQEARRLGLDVYWWDNQKELLTKEVSFDRGLEPQASHAKPYSETHMPFSTFLEDLEDKCIPPCDSREKAKPTNHWLDALYDAMYPDREW